MIIYGYDSNKAVVPIFIGKDNIMAKDRLTPCLYYVCKGECKKDRDADHGGYCQKCDKYKPRARVRHLNQQKLKLEKIRKSED